MKKPMLFYIALLLISSLLLSNSSLAQQHLPEDAKLRLGKGSANDTTFTPDGTQFAVATNIGIWIYDAKTGAEITLLKQRDRGYGKIVFSPDGNVLACATGSNGHGEVQLWDKTAGQLVTTLPAPTGISSLFFSEDGTKLACAGSFGRVHVWEINPDTPPVLVTDIKLSFENWSDLCLTELSPDGRFLAITIPDWQDKEFSIQLWDGKTGERLHTLKGHTRSVTALTFSPDSKTLLTADAYETMRVWDTESGNLQSTMKWRGRTATHALAFSPRGRFLASGHDDDGIRLWHYTGGEVQQWDYAIGEYQNIMDLKAHQDYVYRFAFSPDELTLLTASKDGTIIAWDTTTGTQRFTCEGHQQGMQVVVSYQKFHVVAHNLDETGDLKTECKAHLGEGVRLADWSDILGYYREGGSMADFITELEIPLEYGNPGDMEAIPNTSYRISRNGELRWQGNRHYFFARHDHVKRADFLAHDNVDNYLLSLGSWFGKGGFALCYGDLNSTVPPPEPEVIGTNEMWNRAVPAIELNPAIAPDAPEPELTPVVSYQKFHVVAHNLDETGDLKAECKAQLGEGVRLADWNDILAYYEAGGSMADFIAKLEIPLEYANPEDLHPIPNASYRISRNGELRWNGNRHYFFARHDHVKRAGFLAHDNIDNYLLSLGSWFGRGGFALCYGDLNSTVPPPDPPELPEVNLSPPGSQLFDR